MHIKLYVARDDAITDSALAMIDEAVASVGLGAVDINIIVVASDDEARDLRCLGSPTIRVDGFDIEYGEREPPETTIGERYYSTSEGWGRLPTAGMVSFAIREAQARLAAGSEGNNDLE
jgi:hypothetical protein